MSKHKKLISAAKKNSKLILIGVIAVVIIAAAAVSYSFFFGSSGSSKIAATVNGEQIMKEDVVKEYLKVPVEYRLLISDMQILDGMIAEKLLLQEAKKMGISTSDADLDNFIRDLIVSYGISYDQLTSMLEKSNMTLDEFKESYRKRITIGKLLNATVTGNISVSEDEARAYYDSHNPDFMQNETVRASHILVSNSNEAGIIRQMVLNGSDFAALAMKNSTCPSASQGGDLGWFARGQMVKPFEDAAFALKNIGDISELTETSFGFHIIKLTGRKPAGLVPFADAIEGINKQLLSEKQNAAMKAYSDDLRSKADIVIFMQQEKKPEGRPISEIIRESKDKKANQSESGESSASSQQSQSLPSESGSASSSVASCLSEKGTVMFGSSSSSVSAEQMDLFGADSDKIIYVDCSVQQSRCSSEGITSYPTWVISGVKYTGKYPVERLAELSGCN